MDNFIALYQQHLIFQDATFSRIEHEEAIVAIVYKVTLSTGKEFILKICERPNDYLREIYFLKYFAGKLPVPRMMQVVPPDKNINGAILMEYLPGTLLEMTDLTDALAYEIGSLLARIHSNRTAGYGDLIQPENLSPDPRVHFTQKFEEGLEECSNHLPRALIEQCRSYFHTHLHLLDSADGPCIVHRDFRPGNLIIHDRKVQGIIDWASARASFAEEDFGQWPPQFTRNQSFLAGYASIRPLPDYSAMMPLLRLSKAAATIGFTVKRGTWQSSSARLYQCNRQFLDTFFL